MPDLAFTLPPAMPSTISIIAVSGLHRREALIADLEAALDRHRSNALVFLGDFLVDEAGMEGLLTNEALAERFSRLACEHLIFAPGITEMFDGFAFRSVFDEVGRIYRELDRRTYTIGPMVIVGFPLMSEEYPMDIMAKPSSQPIKARPRRVPQWKAWLPRCLRRHWTASRAVWFMSEPPSGTRLTRLAGPLAGSDDWRGAIHDFAPMLVVCGSDQPSPLNSPEWHDSVRFSTVVHVGQPRNAPLHYMLIEADFTSDTPSLPDSLRVTSMPKGEVLKVR